MEIENIDVANLTPDIRYLDEIRKLCYDQAWAKTAPNLELYYIYRILKEENGLRYDITRIPAKMLGLEFVKTKGHNHQGFYGEIYAVLEGEAFYLFQKGNGDAVNDVCVVKAKKGDLVKIPSGYGHVTINPSATKELKMANWVKKEDKASFAWFEQMHGACYYHTKDGWIKNVNYKQVPELRFEKPLKEIPKNLSFLTKG